MTSSLKPFLKIITDHILPTDSPVTSVCVDPNGKLLVSGHEDASIMLYDICGGRVVQLFRLSNFIFLHNNIIFLRPHGDEVRTVRLSNAAYYLLSSSYDKRYPPYFIKIKKKLKDRYYGYARKFD
jgi:WD40 repeat protein